MTPRQFGGYAGMWFVKQAGGWGAGGKTLGGALGAAAKGYRTATTPVAAHAAKALPKAYQPAAKAGIKAVGVGTAANTAYQTYDAAATSAANAAQNVARQAGVNDQQVLNEVGSRARSQMIPMAYRAVAPAWAGGDNTAVGQQVRQDLGTVARHNISPALFSPSPRAANWTPPERAFHAAVGNPVSAVSGALFAPRPSAQQMWNNVPAQQRSEMATNMFQAAQQPGNSPLANSAQYIFEPALQDRSRVLNKAVTDATNYAQSFLPSWAK